MKLNHVANRITSGHLEFILELFIGELGFTLLRRIPTDVWLRQGDAGVDIQFCETEAAPVGEDKHNSHISFLTETPEQDLRKLGDWFERRGKRVILGSWSDREFWLDAPEVFVDFVLEAMTPDLARY